MNANRHIVPSDDTPKVSAIVRQSMGFIERHLPADQAHGNQRLHFAHVVGLLLSAALHPTVRSLRTIEHHSGVAQMRAITGRAVVPRSTLSDALARFDPEPLQWIIREAFARLPWLKRFDPMVYESARRIVALDGSWFNLAGEVVHALTMNRGSNGVQSRIRLNLQLCLDTQLPCDLDISGAGDGSEANAFIRRLQADSIYVVDRNFVHFGFINAVKTAGSHLVLRLRKNSSFAVQEECPLTDRDRAHGVIEDQRVTFASARASRTGAAPTGLYRRIVIHDHQNQSYVILLTDLLDLPAWMIGELYRGRWAIELFLRWLKVFACFEHLISQSPRGITTQFYVAVLLALFLHMRTGQPVGKHILHIVGLCATGQLSDEAAAMLLGRRARERELERLRRAKKKTLI